MTEQQRKEAAYIILQEYGIDHQVDKLGEECSELSRAVHRTHTHISEESATMNLIEEMADVKILLMQMEFEFKDEINAWVDRKLNRQLGRMNADNNQPAIDWTMN